MTTITEQSATRKPITLAYGNGFGFKPTMFKKDNGVLRLERVAVFRSGTFRDSAGYQNTWEQIHIKQMVDNYEHLRNGGIFDDVPVRDGHPGWLIHGLPGNGAVVGWHTSVVTEKAKAPHDEEEYDYLFADYDITDEEAKAKIENGTWRNRSAEIGTYVTNNEAEFWPVYMGFAYVDIPAVEGLKFRSPNGHQPKLYVMMNDKETGVGDTATTNTAPVQQPQAAGSPAPGASAVLPFAALSATPHVFAVNGTQVTDYAAVQAHINMLEKFMADTTEQNRRNFVTSLAQANKIAATQLDALTEFALGLSPDSYDKWTKTWGEAPTPSLLGQHGQTVTNPDGAGQTVDPKAAQIETWTATVRQHKLAGTPAEAIKKTASYRSLVAAGVTPEL